MEGLTELYARERTWHIRFLSLAQEISTWSKDPSTQVGAVIVRPDRSIASLGYNGFPRGMDDSPKQYNHRAKKLERVVHAEMNAILQSSEDLSDQTLYTWPLPPCNRCAVHVIQTGIKTVVAPLLKPGTDLFARWGTSVAQTRAFLEECGVTFLEIDL